MTTYVYVLCISVFRRAMYVCIFVTTNLTSQYTVFPQLEPASYLFHLFKIYFEGGRVIFGGGL